MTILKPQLETNHFSAALP